MCVCVCVCVYIYIYIYIYIKLIHFAVRVKLTEHCKSTVKLCVCVRDRERESMCLVISDSATPWTVACWAPPSMGFSRQEHWIRVPFPFPVDLPNPGIKLVSLVSSALAHGFFTN